MSREGAGGRWDEGEMICTEWVIMRHFIGYFVSVVVGAAFTFCVSKICFAYVKKYHWKGKDKEEKHVFKIPLGMIERFMYTTALLVGKPEWFAVWLAFKITGFWTGSQLSEDKKLKPHVLFNASLIGNAISIIFAVFGAWIAQGEIKIK